MRGLHVAGTVPVQEQRRSRVSGAGFREPGDLRETFLQGLPVDAPAVSVRALAQVLKHECTQRGVVDVPGERGVRIAPRIEAGQ